MIKTHGLSHVALAVSDPDRSPAFYSSVFGVREYFRSESTIQVLGRGRSMFLRSRNVRRTRASRVESSISVFALPGLKTTTRRSAPSSAPAAPLLRAANSRPVCPMRSCAIQMAMK